MTSPQHSTQTDEPIALTLEPWQVGAFVRVMIGDSKPAAIRHRLDWLYTYMGVASPEEMNKPKANVVRLSDHRNRRKLEREYGFAMATFIITRTKEEVRKRTDFFTIFARALEEELTKSEQVAAKVAARKARKAARK